jgi:23S rRNA pseudouridine1911/1915/1917 synthase
VNAERPEDPPETEEHRVEVGQAGMRIDRFVKDRLPELSRREIIFWIQEQRVLCNGRPARKGKILYEGDRVEFRIPSESTGGGVVPEPGHELRVLREDPLLVAVDKEPGMATHPLHAGERGTVANRLVALYPEMQGVGFSPREPGILHRLDRDTSGVLLAARTDSAFERLRVEFEQGRVVKVYYAVVHGRLAPEGVINRPVASRGRRSSRVEVIPDEGGVRGLRGSSPAETHYSVVRAYRGFSFVRLRMTTGARHQLRAHMAFLGNPVVGDSVYGRPPRASRAGRLPERHLLHAAELRFFHPLKGKPIKIRSPLPPDMRSFLQRLKRS